VFYRSLQAYDAALKGGDPRFGDTKLVMSPQSDFFRYFSDPAGRPKTGAQPLLPPVVPPPAAAPPSPAPATP
jgi:membrane protease subunit HflC